MLEDCPEVVYQLWYDMALASMKPDPDWGWKRSGETARQARDRIARERGMLSDARA